MVHNHKYDENTPTILSHSMRIKYFEATLLKSIISHVEPNKTQVFAVIGGLDYMKKK